MKKNIAHLILFFGLTSGFVASAGASEYIDLQGAVKSFNDKSVEVTSGDSVWTVPRSYVHIASLKTGQTLLIHIKKTEMAGLKYKKIKA